MLCHNIDCKVQAKQVRATIYTLSAPPVSKAEMEYYVSGEKSIGWSKFCSCVRAGMDITGGGREGDTWHTIT